MGAAAPAGGLFAFGSNMEGELGSAANNNPNPSPMLVAFPGQNVVVTHVAAGADFSLAATASGLLYGFGANSSGQLGTTANSNPNPTPVATVLPGQDGAVIGVAAGVYHSLAATASGQLYAFGNNFYGELGSATNNGNSNPNPPALVVLSGQNGPVTQVAAGDLHSLVVTAGGQLYAFGANYSGQLGIATNAGKSNANPTPAIVALPGQSGPVTQVAAGFGHSLVVTASGQLYAFGSNSSGQLGNSNLSSTNATPALVTLPGQSGPVTQVAAGDDYSLVATAGGQLYAFGINDFGQLGIATNSGTSNPNPTPTLVTLPGQDGIVTQLAAGSGHSLVVTASGQLYAFGSNVEGELGIASNSGMSNPNPTPTLVSLPPGTTIDTVAKDPEAQHSLAIVSGLAIAPASLPAGQVGVPYGAGLSATGGTAPLAWSASGLPAGLSINPASGVIAGTPTSAGSFAVTATVIDSYGSAASQAFTVTIAPAPAAPAIATAAPTISGPSEAASVFTEGNALPTIAKKRRHPVGTTFSFTLNEPATVNFAFTQTITGRKVRGRCVATTKQNRRKRACKRTVTVGTLSFGGHPGLNKVRFQGRISSSKKLRLGHYTLLITATAAGKTSAPAALRFTIVKR